MIRTHLADRDSREWVDLLPGIMMAYNEMEQGQHEYSASQIMCYRINYYSCIGTNIYTYITYAA